MKKFLFALSLVCSLALARADVYIINGERIEGEVHDINGQLTICTDELCMIIPPDAQKVSSTTPAESVRPSVAADATGDCRNGETPGSWVRQSVHRQR